MISKFFKYVSLNVIGMVGISLYILADTFFISKALGTDGLAALNFTLAIFNIMNGLGLMIGIGGAARYSILNSLGKKEAAGQIFMNSLYIGAAVSFVLMITGAFFIGDILSLLGADGAALAHSQVYMSTMLSFSPCFILNTILTAFIRNDNNPQICMTATLTSSISNIILDYFFIFILNQGMYGAVFATGLAPIISMLILTKHLRSKNNTIALHSSTIDIKKIGSLAKLGVSSLISELSSAITVTVFNFVLLKINGNTGVAAYGIIANVALVATSVFSGVAQGIQPLASKEYGHSNNQSLLKLIKYSAITAITISAAIYLTVFFKAEKISDFFNSEKNDVLAQISIDGLEIYFFGFFFAGINVIAASFFSAVDSAKKAFVTSILRSAVLIVPSVLVLSSLLGIKGVWLSFTVTEFLACIVTIINICKSEYFNFNKKNENIGIT